MVRLHKQLQITLIAAIFHVLLAVFIYSLFLFVIANGAVGLSGLVLALILIKPLPIIASILAGVIGGFVLREMKYKSALSITVPAGSFIATSYNPVRYLFAGNTLGILFTLLILSVCIYYFTYRLRNHFFSSLRYLSTMIILLAVTVVSWSFVSNHLENQRTEKIKASVSGPVYYLPAYGITNEKGFIHYDNTNEKVKSVEVPFEAGIEVVSAPLNMVNFEGLDPPTRCDITESYNRQTRNTSGFYAGVQINRCKEHVTNLGRVFYEEIPDTGVHETFYTIINDTVVYIHFDRIGVRKYREEMLPELKNMFDSLEVMDANARNKLVVWN